MSGSRGFWPMRDLPVVGWLLATIVVALAHPFFPAPRWLLIHLTLLGAVTHSILVWSRYFTETLLRVPDDGSRTAQSRRLALLNVGALVVMTGVTTTVWPLTLIGGTAVFGAVVWHGSSLARALRAALMPRFGVVVRYYLAAASLLPLGVVAGVWVARVQTDPWHERLMVAHASINLLGWVGLTITGTLVTLWPTMLRTRMAEGVEQAAKRALPVLLGAIAVTVAGALGGLPRLSALGLAGYLGGLLLLAPSFVKVARQKAARTFSTASALGAVAWLTGSLVALTMAFATTGSWAVAGDRFGWFVPFLAAGFAAQMLLGALSYLIPVAIGGGPRAVAVATRVLDRAGVLRAVVLNAALLACVLPVPPTVRIACSGVALVALASFLPLLVLAIRASVAARRDAAEPGGGRVEVPTPAPARTAIAAGLAIVLAATVAGLVVDDQLAPDGPSASAGVTATGKTTTVQVEADDMRFTPSTIEVPVGNRLVIELTNTDDEQVHDLVLDDGTDSGRLAPGEKATVEVPIVGRDIDAWCSVVGHRQMGMVMTIVAVGAKSTPDSTDHDSTDHGDMDHGGMDHGDMGTAAVPDDFEAHDATLPPVGKGRMHRRTFRVEEAVREVSPGVMQTLWTYNGTAPGPTLHGKVGDTFVITLINDGTIGHSIDFHAGALAPDQPMRTIPPGERLTYRFTATRAGIWMYHCSSMPMSGHIANGLFGAVIIDPPDLAPVDRTYVLLQSEYYLGADVDGQPGVVDMDALEAGVPDLVTFNGYANQYDHRPLPARVGERVRIWVLDAGPNRASAFHVVGGQFDTVYSEGDYLLRRGDPGGSQTLGLLPSQGGFVELTFPEAGHYPFVSHVMVDAERGAHGVFEVTKR